MLKPGLVIDSPSGRIELMELLEIGGQASVWKIRELDEGRRVLAAKIVSGQLSKRTEKEFQDLSTQMGNEIAILSTLNHRFIGNYLYSINYVDLDGDFIAVGFAMHFAPIGTLKELLKDTKTNPQKHLNEQEKILMIRRISQGVADIHNSGIVHSDIKAENILLQMQDQLMTPVLIDFGGAFHVHQAWPGLRTIQYSSPELEDGSPASIPSDIYALGVLVSEILSGERQWQPSAATLDELHFSESGNAFRGILRRMLASDPEKRPEPNAIWKAFQNLEVEHTVSASRAEKIIKFPVGKYIWKPHVHFSYDGVKTITFLKSSNPTTDARLLRKILDRHNFQGASVHRVFGRHDFYVELWVTDDKMAAFRSSLKQFQSEQPHESYQLNIDRFEIFRMVAENGRKVQSLDGPIIDLMVDRFENQGPDEVVNKLFIKENSPAKAEIRCLLSMTPKEKMDSRQLTIIVELLVEYLGNCKHLTRQQKLTTKVMASSFISQIIVSVPVSNIRKYTDLMLGSSQHLKKKMLKLEDSVFDFSTFIDMDGNGFFDGENCYFSDDGLIPTKIREEYY